MVGAATDSDVTAEPPGGSARQPSPKEILENIRIERRQFAGTRQLGSAKRSRRKSGSRLSKTVLEYHTNRFSLRGAMTYHSLTSPLDFATPAKRHASLLIHGEGSDSADQPRTSAPLATEAHQ